MLPVSDNLFKQPIAAVIPCLNEAAAIGSVVRSILAQLPTVIVVDDGSRDATTDVARGAGAEVLRHDSPRGKGAALASGWRHALKSGFRHGLSMDGDGQHAAGDIPAFIKCAERTGASLVVGNRMDDPRQMPWLRRGVNRWMSRQLARLAMCPVPDSQCGFRLMDLAVWDRLPISATHFEIESEVLLSFFLAGERVEFVPIQAIYRGEQSKIHPLRDTLRWWRWWRRAKAAARHVRA